MNIRIESNFNLALLKAEFLSNDSSLSIDDGGYDQISTNIYNDESSLYQSDYDVLILFLNIEFLTEFSIFSDPFGCDLDEEYQKVEEAVENIFLLVDRYHSAKPNTPICLLSFPYQPNTPFNYLETNTQKHSINRLVTRINSYLFAKAIDRSNTYVFDINNTIINYGYKTLYDTRMWYLAKSPFSHAGAQYLAHEMTAFLRCVQEPSKKMLILDLDNTLWGGVVGEDGIEGIDISSDGYGKAFFDFQNEILNLKKRGVLLALCSKNNEDDVKNVFDNHPDMVLSWNDFVIKKINWIDKATNIKDIADTINIGIDSIVFIDDNPAERQWVKSSLNDIVVPDFPDDPAELKNFILSLGVFNTFHITAEDLEKTNLYKADIKRKQLKNNNLSYDEFIVSLGIHCTVKELESSEVKRAVQLLAKTNQFNATTKRYNEEEVRHYINDSTVKVLSLAVSDKFGDYGFVGLAIIIKQDKKAVLDTFLLSCRVLGKNVERYFLAAIMECANKELQCDRLDSLYIPSNKNAQIKVFFEANNFKSVINDSGIIYYSAKDLAVNYPENIKVANGR